MDLSISKEEGFKEVIAEVSILDLGGVIKQVIASTGCLAVFAALGQISSAAGIDITLPGWGYWVFWLLMVWGCLAAMTERKSYHEFSWYFPRLRWWASLLFACYFLGLVGLYYSPLRDGSWLSAFVFVAYLFPFIIFMAVIELGHNKLMQKRQRAVEER